MLLEPQTIASLVAGVAEQVPPKGLIQRLNENGGRPLNVKLGFDPTAPDLHIGHAVVLRKLREFQDAGHSVIVIIGDFTARIGDPTGRQATRPSLTEEQVEVNAQTYISQLGRVLDLSRVTVRRNSEWLSKIGLEELIRLLGHLTLSRITSRDDFRNRIRDNTPISLHELLYPILQGYDSYAIDADIEIGGSDQLFNCMVGRDVQEHFGRPPQTVMTMPLLVGLDGVEKMSKSKHNTIALTDAPNDMFGKCMSIPDDLIPSYLLLASDISRPSINEMIAGLEAKQLEPMPAKKELAHSLVRLYHGEPAAAEATNYFSRVVQEKQVDAAAFELRDSADFAGALDEASLLDILHWLEPGKTRSALRRLLNEGAVEVGGQRVTDPLARFAEFLGDTRVRIGRRGFYRIETAEKGS